MILKGKVWKLGDNISATDLVSERYDADSMNRRWDICAQHVLEDIIPGFSGQVKTGDIIVAGKNFGRGHAHYYAGAIMGTKTCGIGAILAEGANTLFLRTSIDFGMLTWTFSGISELVETGEEIEFNLESGLVKNLSQGSNKQLSPVSPIIIDILKADGSDKWALARVLAKRVNGGTITEGERGYESGK
jgi:3-isopropylmalate/(R)-2-methylmalate dehydratase small subunit